MGAGQVDYPGRRKDVTGVSMTKRDKVKALLEELGIGYSETQVSVFIEAHHSKVWSPEECLAEFVFSFETGELVEFAIV